MASGDSVLALALEHVGEKYILGSRAPLGNSNWRGPWDCAEFVSWCLYQTTGIIYGCEPQTNAIAADAYTGFWASQAERDHATTSINEAAGIAGACLLRRPGANGIGHIAISDGSGGTVEAHNKIRGVVTESISGRRWDYGILVPGVEYFSNEQPVKVVAPSGAILRVTTPFMRGPTIRKLQEALKMKGYHPGSVDGIYGPQTAHAVHRFQDDSGLVADGEAGSATLVALTIV